MGHPNFCRGALPPRQDSVLPQMRAAFSGMMTRPLGSTNWRAKLGPMGMLGNDRYGNCAWAGLLHLWQGWTANNGAVLIPDTACALADYGRATGFSAGPPVVNDNGTVLASALAYAMQTGLAIQSDAALRMLGAAASIQPDDLTGIMRACDLFGCCYTGMALPGNAEDDFAAGREWRDMTGQPEDGHCPPILDYDLATRTFYCLTWGRVQTMSFDYWLKYGTEAHAILSRDWLGPTRIAPSGLSMATMDGMIRDLGGAVGAYS